MGFWKYVLGTPRNYALTPQKQEKNQKNHKKEVLSPLFYGFFDSSIN